MVYAYIRKLKLIGSTYHKSCIQVIQPLYYTCSQKDWLITELHTDQIMIDQFQLSKIDFLLKHYLSESKACI